MRRNRDRSSRSVRSFLALALILCLQICAATSFHAVPERLLHPHQQRHGQVRLQRRLRRHQRIGIVTAPRNAMQCSVCRSLADRSFVLGSLHRLASDPRERLHRARGGALLHVADAEVRWRTRLGLRRSHHHRWLLPRLLAAQTSAGAQRAGLFRQPQEGFECDDEIEHVALLVLTAGSQSRRVWAPRRLCAPSSSSALSSQCKSKSGHTVSAALASIERATCRLAIIVVQESSEVIEEIKTLVVFPLLPVLLTIGDCCANLAVLTPRCCCAKVTWRSGSGWLSTSTRLAILLLNRRPKRSRKQTDVSALSAAVSNRRSIFRRPQRES